MSLEDGNLDKNSSGSGGVDGDAPVTSSVNKHGGPPILFFSERSFFGNRTLKKPEWISHPEMYECIGSVIDAAHITGLQRIRGLWRIYVESLDDKVDLLTRGASLRGKPIELLNTNPNRLDGEGTTQVRVKNIPLSVDDKVISHALIQRGLDVITLTREKLRINGKLTNCQTGDRIVAVNTLSLKEPLPPTMAFSHYKGRVIHYGQPRQNTTRDDKCAKCLESGHRKADCPNDWKCISCHAVGHRKGDCPMPNVDQTGENTADNESPADDTASSKSSTVVPARETIKPVKPSSKKGNKISPPSGQTMIDSYIHKQSSNVETPTRTSKHAGDRSPPTPAEVLHDLIKRGRRATSEDRSSGEHSEGDDEWAS